METTMAMLVASSEIASTCLRGHPQGCCWVPLHKKRRVYAMEKTLPYYGWWMIIRNKTNSFFLNGKVKNVSTRETEISLRSSHAGFTGRILGNHNDQKNTSMCLCAVEKCTLMVNVEMVLLWTGFAIVELKLPIGRPMFFSFQFPF